MYGFILFKDPAPPPVPRGRAFLNFRPVHAQVARIVIMSRIKRVEMVEPVEREKLFDLEMRRNELIATDVLHHFVEAFCTLNYF